VPRNQPAPSSQPPAPLPIEALRIADDSAALLHELGIQTIDQLLALPREELASRFGEELLRRLDQLTGRGRELIEPHRGLPALAASYALEEPTGDRDVLIEVFSQLVDQLWRQLAARDQGAVVVMCLLRCTDGREVPLRVGLLQPSANARQILELIELHLETVRLADEVDRVELRAAVAGRLSERQRELFADRWPTDPHQLALLVNRLSSRLGQERVLRAELRKSPVPERAVTWRPAVRRKEWESGRGGDKERSRRSRSPSLSLSLSLSLPLPPRPLVLYPKPEAMEVVCVAPDGPPQFVWMGKHRERIVSCMGPERIETLWWRGPSVRRDYYRVATQSGGHLWMFRQLADGRWFVHGEFS
jgi:protein ImuB